MICLAFIPGNISRKINTEPFLKNCHIYYLECNKTYLYSHQIINNLISQQFESDPTLFARTHKHGTQIKCEDL